MSEFLHAPGELPWLAESRQHLQSAIAAEQVPHALLISGRQGLGKRELALWFTTQLLGPAFAAAVSAADDEGPLHPDFLQVAPPEGKFVIPIDTIRQRLIPFLSLTSHGSGTRVALLNPASALNRASANSLLKVLEEPPPGCVLILLAERPGQVLPTVRSRCQCLTLAPPAPELAAAWLAEQAPDKDFATLLDFCGGAPLAALELNGTPAAEFANRFVAALGHLEHKQMSPVDAASLAKAQPSLALDLLEWRVAQRIRASFEPAAAAGRHPAAVRQAGYGQLTQIRELRRVINGGINAELSLAGLLLDWYGGLGH